MAEGKKGFILYADQKELFSQLSDQKAGILIKHIFEYVNDENPINKDAIINMAFTPIKQQLKRDLKKYENICDRNRLNGSKGGRPKNPEEPKEPSGLLGNPKKPKKPDNDNDTDNDKETDKIKKNIPVLIEFCNYAKTIEIYHSSFDFQVRTKYESWIENGWKDGNNKRIINWKTKLKNSMVYFKKEYSTQSKPLKII